MQVLDERTEELRKIKEEVLSGDTLPLYEERLKNKVFPVIGEGNHYAKVMFIGEAPGRNEAASGRPFCGAAGKILDKLLLSIGIERSSVYITNILKDRPPMNRDPLPQELSAYAPFLDRQIEIIQPNLIATLGRFSMSYILQKFKVPEAGDPISKIHGKIFKGEAGYGNINILPLYHPAVAIYNPKTYEDLKDDFQTLKQFLK